MRSTSAGVKCRREFRPYPVKTVPHGGDLRELGPRRPRRDRQDFRDLIRHDPRRPVRMRLHLTNMDIRMIESDLDDPAPDAIDILLDGQQNVVGICQKFADHRIGQNALLHIDRQPTATRMPDDGSRQELCGDRVVRVQRNRVRHAGVLDAVGG